MLNIDFFYTKKEREMSTSDRSDSTRCKCADTPNPSPPPILPALYPIYYTSVISWNITYCFAKEHDCVFKLCEDHGISHDSVGCGSSHIPGP